MVPPGEDCIFAFYREYLYKSEMGDGTESAEVFAPTALGCRQWVNTNIYDDWYNEALENYVDQARACTLPTTYSACITEFLALESEFGTHVNDDLLLIMTGDEPVETIWKEEARKLLEYAIEGRRRVKEQLRKTNPAEFGDVALGYIDLDTGAETIVEVASGRRHWDWIKKSPGIPENKTGGNGK